MSLPSVKRQWAYINGMFARIEKYNASLPDWRGHVEGPEVCNHNEDGEAAPFVIWDGWDQKRKVAKLCGRGPEALDRFGRPHGNYPDFGDRFSEGFSDEYTICTECNDKLIRTSPDSYCWRPDFHVGDGYIMCADCMASDPEAVIADYLNENKALPEGIDPGDHGYEQVNDHSFESGWHPGQTDDPADVLAALNGIDVLFTAESSQFYTTWDVWVPGEYVERARELLGIVTAES